MTAMSPPAAPAPAALENAASCGAALRIPPGSGLAFVQVKDGPAGLALARGVPSAPLDAVLDGALPRAWDLPPDEWLPAVGSEAQLGAALRWLAAEGRLDRLAACDPAGGVASAAEFAESARRAADWLAGLHWVLAAGMLAGLHLAFQDTRPRSRRVPAGACQFAGMPPEAFAVTAPPPDPFAARGLLLCPDGGAVQACAVKVIGPRDAREPQRVRLLEPGLRRLTRAQASAEALTLASDGYLEALRISGGHAWVHQDAFVSRDVEATGAPFQAGLASDDPCDDLADREDDPAIQFATLRCAGDIVHPGIAPLAGRARRPVRGICRPLSPFRS